MKDNSTQPDELAKLVIVGMQQKKAEEIAIIDLRTIKNALADFFIICSGNSDTQVDAIANSVSETVVKSIRQHATHIEGKGNNEWVLLDYGDVVAHVFRKDRRAFYSLEDLWGDAGVRYLPDNY